MDIKRYITREDFLKIVLARDGGTLLSGRRYALPPGAQLSAENQLAKLGEPDKIGEGIIDRVFFFEMFKDLYDDVHIFALVSAEIVERYKFVSDQECQKELALISAKIKRNERNTEGI